MVFSKHGKYLLDTLRFEEGIVLNEERLMVPAQLWVKFAGQFYPIRHHL
ncbi:MAG: hypothetical protein ACFE8P_09055 [Promethearchaeota archaeon]